MIKWIISILIDAYFTVRIKLFHRDKWLEERVRLEEEKEIKDRQAYQDIYNKIRAAISVKRSGEL